MFSNNNIIHVFIKTFDKHLTFALVVFLKKVLLSRFVTEFSPRVGNMVVHGNMNILKTLHSCAPCLL